MKTILTALLIFLSSISFGQKDTSLNWINDSSAISNAKTLVYFPDSSSVRDIQIKDVSRWNAELERGQITKRDFETLMTGNKDLKEMDSLARISEDSAFEAGTRIETLEMVKLKDSGIAQSRSFIYPFFHQFVTKPVVEKQDVIIYSLQFVAGLADGMNQALVYHHALAGHPFWDYSTSWHRKYKNYPTDQRAAFPGAKTWSVMFTDGNHLTRGINRGASIISVAIAMSEHDKWYEIVKEAIIASLINRLGFTLVYDHILKQ